MSTSSQTPAFRIKAIKVKSPDPRSVLALLPPEIKKPKFVFKAAPKAVAVLVEQKVEVTSQVISELSVEQGAVAVEQMAETVSAIEAVTVQQNAEQKAVQQDTVLLETPKFLPDVNSILAILPVDEDEMEVERFGTANAETKALVQERIAYANEFEVTPAVQEAFSEVQTPTIETAEIEMTEVEALEVATREAEIPTLPAIGKPNVFDVASKIGKWIRGHVKIQANRKRLRVCESVSLGEKRFIAVVQLDGKEFLVGGAPNSLSLLANVGKNTNTTFAEVLNESYEQGRNQG